MNLYLTIRRQVKLKESHLSKNKQKNQIICLKPCKFHMEKKDLNLMKILRCLRLDRWAMIICLISYKIMAMNYRMKEKDYSVNDFNIISENDTLQFTCIMFLNTNIFI